MSQQTDVLKHLKSGCSITPWQTLNRYECFRLASVIHRLRDKGHKIETRIVGEPRHAMYVMRAK